MVQVHSSLWKKWRQLDMLIYVAIKYFSTPTIILTTIISNVEVCKFIGTHVTSKLRQLAHPHGDHRLSKWGVMMYPGGCYILVRRCPYWSHPVHRVVAGLVDNHDIKVVITDCQVYLCSLVYRRMSITISDGDIASICNLYRLCVLYVCRRTGPGFDSTPNRHE